MKIIFNEVSEVTPETVQGKNLFNPADVQEDAYVNSADGLIKHGVTGWTALKERIAKRPKSEGGRPYPDHVSATGKFDQLPPHIQKKVLDNHKKK